MSDSSDTSIDDDKSGPRSEVRFGPQEVKDIEDEDDEEEYEGEGDATKADECFCSFFDKEVIPKLTLDEYRKSQLKETPLFSNILTLDSDDKVCIEKPSDDPNDSILVTGFGIRNLASMQNALEAEEHKRLYELYKTIKPEEKKQEPSSSSSDEITPKKDVSKRTIQTETEITTASSDTTVQQEKVRYLMGLDADGCEEGVYPQEEDLIKKMLLQEPDDKFVFAETSTMRSAQMYLRTHRIFDFFQFIIAHLLSAAPENPIGFILVFLNKILLYRSGTGHPPLLYERKHIEQLFRLMDRMNTGFIDVKQYESGMNTLGICEYNKSPPLSEDGLVAKEVFVQEALESETALFNDLIKRKWTGSKPMMMGTFSNISSQARSYISGSYLFPSDLMPRTKKEWQTEKIMEEGE